MRVLLARLQAVIRRSHGQVPPILGGAGLSLDEDRQAVIRDGVPCALSLAAVFAAQWSAGRVAVEAMILVTAVDRLQFLGTPHDS